jgi:glycosyltransferase involved in cell wall biosynthesis
LEFVVRIDSDVPSPSGSPQRIAAIFDMFGPYHVARLNALARSARTLGIEIAGRSKVYAWDRVTDATLFERRTLFEVTDSAALQRASVDAALKKALADFQPDAVLVPGWSTVAAVAAARWCFKEGVGAVVMSESTRNDARRVAWKESLKSRFIGMFDAGLVGGQAQKEYLRSLGVPEDCIFLGYNAVDNEFFRLGAAHARAAAAEVRSARGLPERYVLASARFISIKNLDGLLEAFAEFRRLRPESETHLVLLGDGPEAERLREKVRSLGLERLVLMPGFKQYGDLPAYYGLARAFVHVSRIEPWGLVVNEAMASGLPVLVSRETGCAGELVEHGRNGFVEACDDTRAIAGRLAELDDADDDAISEMGRASDEIVARYACARFAAGAVEAARVAQDRRRRPRSVLGRAAVSALYHSL